MGRKRKIPEFDESLLTRVEGMARIGLNRAQIAKVMGVHRSTFCSYTRANPVIRERFKVGKAQAQLRVGKTLFEKALSGDMAAIRWWEITRAGRSEKTALKVTANEYVIPMPEELTEETGAS